MDEISDEKRQETIDRLERCIELLDNMKKRRLESKEMERQKDEEEEEIRQAWFRNKFSFFRKARLFVLIIELYFNLQDEVDTLTGESDIFGFHIPATFYREKTIRP